MFIHVQVLVLLTDWFPSLDPGPHLDDPPSLLSLHFFPTPLPLHTTSQRTHTSFVIFGILRVNKAYFLTKLTSKR